MSNNEGSFQFVGDQQRSNEHWYAAVPDDVLHEIFEAGYKARELDVREDDNAAEKVIDKKFNRLMEAKLRGTQYERP